MKLNLKKVAKDPFLYLSVFFLFILTAVFIIYPILEALKLSLTKDGEWTLSSYIYFFKKDWLRKSFSNSIILGVLSSTTSVIIGYLYAFVTSKIEFKGKSFFRFMGTLPLICPPFMLSLSLILLFGKNGFITKQILNLDSINIYGLWGLVLAQTISQFPIAYLTMQPILQRIDTTLEDAAFNLGAPRFSVFKDITLRLSLPGIISAWLICFVTSLADFANPMILAGSFDVLSVQAYLQFTGMGNLELGAAISILLLIPSLSAYFIQKSYLLKKSFVTITGKPQRTRNNIVSKRVKPVLIFTAFMIAVFIIILYITVLAGCFTKAWGIDYSFSLENFSYIFQIGWDTIFNTILLSTISTPIAGIMGLFIAFIVVRKRIFGSRLLDALSLIPFALPGTVIGIGFLLAFNQPPFLLTGTASIIVLCFVYRNMPVGVEAAKSSLLQIDKSIEEAAQDLGAGTLRVFREMVTPLIKPAFFAGMAYSFVRAMTAVSAVIFLVSAKWNHMTVLILSQTEMLRFSAAAVLCLILIAIVLVAFWLMKKLLRVDLLERSMT